MKIVATVRTRNEARNIEKFCLSYQWADLILVADGGSEDNTIEVASLQPKTKVRSFTERRGMRNRYWRNPEGAHLNFLADWAMEEGADWIIEDDCDCRPNYLLKENARGIFESTEMNFILAVRMYLWRDGDHFPNMASPGGKKKWEASFWAWRATVPLRFYDSSFAYEFTPKPTVDDSLRLLPPYCLLHYSWVDEDVLRKKMKFYDESGQIPGIRYPLDYAGELEPLPEWAHE